jgi:hypothetical protein
MLEADLRVDVKIRLTSDPQKRFQASSPCGGDSQHRSSHSPL